MGAGGEEMLPGELPERAHPSLVLQVLTRGYFPPSFSSFAFPSVSRLVLQESRGKRPGKL